MKNLNYKMKELNYKDIPFGWALCFHDECPLAASCLRHHCGTLVPDSQLTYTTVSPKLEPGDGCQLFVANEPVQMAYGMHGLTVGLNVIETKLLNRALYAYFGSRSHYYRFRNCKDDRPGSVSGIKPKPTDDPEMVKAVRQTYGITPRMQADIAEMFNRLELSYEPVFDLYQECYYFPENRPADN